MSQLPVFENIKQFLSERKIPFREVHHEPTRTSEESARVRGVSIEIGGKAILMKTDDNFRLFVISAARKVDSSSVKKHLGVKKLRFASAEELQQLTGLMPGSVPPFGHPILPFDLYIDESIGRNAEIAFNAGSLTDSLILRSADYLAVAGGEMFSFSG